MIWNADARRSRFVCYPSKCVTDSRRPGEDGTSVPSDQAAVRLRQSTLPMLDQEHGAGPYRDEPRTLSSDIPSHAKQLLTFIIHRIALAAILHTLRGEPRRIETGLELRSFQFLNFRERCSTFFDNKVLTVSGLHNKTCNRWCDDN